MVSGIVAVAENGVIGRKGDLPWHLPDDMKFFASTTRGHHIITGRVNYESIPLRFRPLKDRTNLVITRNKNYDPQGAILVNALQEAIDLARKNGDDEVFIIGGGEIFKQAIEQDLMDRLYLTRIHADVEGDVFFPELDPAEWRTIEERHHAADERHAHSFTFLTLERVR